MCVGVGVNVCGCRCVCVLVSGEVGYRNMFAAVIICIMDFLFYFILI